jgi:Flp pilus assembly protein CpaB
MELTAFHGAAAPGTRPPRRMDVRAIAGVLILLLATGGSITFWASLADTQRILVATRDLPSGATLGMGDLAIAQVRLDEAVYRASVPAEELPGLVGKQLAEPVHAQQLLARAQISSRPPLGPNQLALTIPVKPESAAGGRIRPGDVVTVLWTTSKGRPDSLTTVVLPRVTVYDVGRDDRLTVVNGGASTDSAGRSAPQGPIASVTLIVTKEQALDLAEAKWNGDLDVALLPPDRS